MLPPLTKLAVRLSRRTALTLPRVYRVATSSRRIASSSRITAQVQADVKGDAQHPSQHEASTDEPQKLGKRARKAIKARQRQEQDRAAKEAMADAKAQSHGQEVASLNFRDKGTNDAASGSEAILRAKHVLNASDGTPTSSTSPQHREVDHWRSKVKSQDGSDPTAGWSGSLFRNHISSLLSGFGTSPITRQLPDSDVPAAFASTITDTRPKAASTGAPSSKDEADKASTRTTYKKGSSFTPFMTKSERMESQARVIFQAIREARERGIVDEDESFFYPYPEGVPPKDLDGKDAVWLNLGPDPEAWGREIPQVKDRWLEVLSLGLTKEISGRPGAGGPSSTEQGMGDEEQASHDENAFDDLVEDFDLEDHERLEQLGDSIVNMSSRLLAYHSYPDVNEGSLTRLSNYPTQNNFLALLFQECGLAARRDEVRRELRKARTPDCEQEVDDAAPTKRPAKRDGETAQTEEDKARLPLLIKRDADMFEAYAAAVFLSNGNDFNVVHNWLCHLFRPFQDQAYRFMVQRSEALARLQANRAAAAAATASASAASAAAPTESDSPAALASGPDGTSSPTNLAADGLGIKSASVDPSSVPFSSLFPDFSRGAEKSSSAIPAYALTNASQAFITDEFLTVAARARRQREERLREELRLQDQQELMNMGWFRKGFLNLRTGFRQYVMGKDVVREEEARIRQKVNEQRGMSEKDRQRLRAKERNAAGVSIKSTGSKKKKKVAEVEAQ